MTEYEELLLLQRYKSLISALKMIAREFNKWDQMITGDQILSLIENGEKTYLINDGS